MLNVKKRDGSIVPFNLNKIKVAIEKAFAAVGKNYNDDIIDMLALRVTADFNSKLQGDTITVEDIQDSVEVVLIQASYVEVSKAYILYRKQHEKLRNVGSTMLDYKNTVDNYLKINDWRVKENSTVTYSVGGLILSNSGAITANYWLSEIYDDEISNAHRNAEIHIHDLSMLTGYCAGWSLKQLIVEGLGGIPGKITSSPASHLSTLCNQMVNFLGIMQNEWAGAQAFSSFDTYLAPFVKVDNLSYKEVKQCLQSFVYGVNTPSRWGTQAPFTNITLDWVVPNDLAELPAIVGGKEMDFKYKDCVKEMAMVNKAFIEIMIEGDANGRGFQYPIPTYSITSDFDWSETENNRLLFEMTAKYGTPYFSNYINSDMEPSDVRSMCCRLRLDLRELRKKAGGFFGSGESTGSVGVVTINMPRIAYEAKTEEEYFQNLERLMNLSARSLKIKRNVITKLMEEGLYPYTKRYLGTFSNHFSTIGLVGMNEACLNARWIGKDLTHKEAQEFTKKTLNFMRNKLSDYQELYGDLYNLEATPAESTSYRLAKHDKAKYPNIITASMGKGEDAAPYYTNSSHQQFSPARRLHVRHFRRPRHSGRTADSLHFGHGLPRFPRSETGKLAGGGKPRQENCRKLQASLLYALSDLLHLRAARISRRRTVHLPHLRQKSGGLQPHNGLLPSRPELERRQTGRVQGAQNLRHRLFPSQKETRLRQGSLFRPRREKVRSRNRRHHNLHHQDLPQLQAGEIHAGQGGHSLHRGGRRGRKSRHDQLRSQEGSHPARPQRKRLRRLRQRKQNQEVHRDRQRLTETKNDDGVCRTHTPFFGGTI